MWRWVLLLLVQNVKGSDPGGYSRPGPRPAGVPPRQPPTTSPTQPPSNYAASAFTTYGSIGDALPEALFTHGRDRPKSDTPGGIADLMNLLESLEVVHPPSASATENTHGSASLDGVAMKSKKARKPPLHLPDLFSDSRTTFLEENIEVANLLGTLTPDIDFGGSS